MQESIDAITQTIAANTLAIAQATAAARQSEARAFNRSARYGEHELESVPNAVGAAPANFPATLHAFGHLGGGVLNNLLAFYAVAVPANARVDHKRALLGRAVGVRYSPE